MKKLLLLAAGFASYFASAQNLNIQNYSPYNISYTIWKSNQSSVATGCNPGIESKLLSGALPVLPFSPSPGAVSVDAYYQGNVNTSNTFNPSYPNTPLIDGWMLNGTLYNIATTPIPPIFSTVTSWTGIKFMADIPGGGTAGGYSLGLGCGTVIATNVSSPNPSTPFNGTFFTFAGDTWIVFN